MSLHRATWGCKRCNRRQANAIAAVRKPSFLRKGIPDSAHEWVSLPRMVHGIWKTVPMLTRIARRCSGLLQAVSYIDERAAGIFIIGKGTNNCEGK